MRLEYQDNIDRYVLGQMTHDERREFEEKVANNDELKEQLLLIQNVRSIIEREERSEILKRIKQRDEDRNKIRYSQSSNRSIKYWISGIAAVFVVGFFFHNYNRTSSDYMANLCEGSACDPCSQGAFRSVDVTIENLLSKGDYIAALDRTEKMEIEIETELLIIERENGVRGPEKDNLSIKIDSIKMKQDGCNLLKAQALIGLNRIEEAMAILDKLRHSNSEYGNEADSLYNVLKN